ncbi:TetR/AcrR family transcriptional regulator [Phytohabitans suffuscus]|uniref:TetR/AcrR family transcriptional regulator n=1 Tax=Phytohabitans suffuscus TaxID=624315 RepID=UPI0015D3CA75|nr:TetR/AcrR family transcriptional regulator [Phytohabitans suffuscus]
MSSQPPKRAPAKSTAAHDSDRELRTDARRNRERVLRTAQRLFATQGLGVSLDEIARRAGVGPGTVHRHFPARKRCISPSRPTSSNNSWPKRKHSPPATTPQPCSHSCPR